MPPKKGQDNKKPARTPARTPARIPARTPRQQSNTLTTTEVYDEGENDFSINVHANLMEDDEISSADEDIAANITQGCAISDNDLLDDLSPTDIEALVQRLLPGICQQDVQDFLAQIPTHHSPPFAIPRHERETKSWPSTYEESDLLWEEGAKAERAIKLPVGTNMPKWLDMAEDQLGSIQDSLVVVSSYPTAKDGSTVHASYGTTMDLSNQCMNMLYSKLGLHLKSVRPTGALHVDVFPRRINRDNIDGLGNVVDEIPTNLRLFWQCVAQEWLARLQAKIALLVGAAAVNAYLSYLDANHVQHQQIWLAGGNNNYGADNTTLRTILSIPNLSNATLNVLLTGYKKISKEEVEGTKAMRKTMEVELTEKPSYWDRADVISKYGHHAFTFKSIAERREGPRESTKPKTQPLALSLYEIDGNPFLERYNTTVALSDPVPAASARRKATMIHPTTRTLIPTKGEKRTSKIWKSKS
ncbi:hypothetical protein J4E81_003929 [Alternaria sp. BMP 2799]|nr:hypothetical protein J4E81_003929 [Alternaria sp. BMP 2799]